MGETPNSICEIQNIGRKTREILVDSRCCPAMAESGMAWAGVSWTTPEFRFVRHRPAFKQLLVATHGRGRVYLHGGWQQCPSGNAYLTPPGHLHAYQAGPGWQVVWVILEPSAPFDFPKKPELREADGEALFHIISGLHLEASTLSRLTSLDRWAALLRDAVQAILAPQVSSLWRLWRAVQSDLATHWSLESLAKIAGLGEESLRVVCQKEQECSPMQHVTRLRMNHAESLLRSGQKVEFVAHRVGYENPFAFSVAFKRHKGVSPGQLRAGGPRVQRPTETLAHPFSE